MPITTVGGRTFDCELGNPDPRSEAYPVSAMLGATVYVSAEDRILQTQITAAVARIAALEGKPTPIPPPTPVPPVPVPAAGWTLAVSLDQQQTGMCVGYGNTNWLASSPRMVPVKPGAGGDDEGSTPDVVYDKAQDEDGSPEDPNTGASITGGAKALQALGYISAYHWATSVTDVVAGLTIVPGVLGINWKQDMFTPDAEGIIHYTGAVAGGHCIEVLNHDATRGLFELPNSWGKSWGVNGRCYVPEADLAKMLADQGEAVFYSKN